MQHHMRMTMVKNYLMFYLVDRTALTVTIVRAPRGRRNRIGILTEQYSSS